MQRIAKVSFIVVPSRHTGFSNLQKFSPFGSRYLLVGHHLDFAHHRWVFHVRIARKFEAVAEWAGVARTPSKFETMLQWLSSLPSLNAKKQGIR